MKVHTPHVLSRRQFLAAGAGAALGSRHLLGDDERPKIKFIDIHTHLGVFSWGREVTVEVLLAFMDAHNIERAVILPLVSPEAAPYLQTTEMALAAYRRHPDRIIPFCALDPRSSTLAPQRAGHVNGVRGIFDILKRYRDAGAKGLGEHKTGLPFDHPSLMMLYEACAELDLPILFHLDDIRNPDTPGLPRLENVLKSFPKLPLIGHAAGFWASVSGDATLGDFGRYPTLPKPVVPGGAIDRLMDQYPNLHGDLSERAGYCAIARDPSFGRDFVIRRADRLLFGSDFLMPDQEIPLFGLLDSLDLPADVLTKVCRGNAIRLLKLPDHAA